MSSVFKALADPTRRRVLQLLRERAMSAGELAEHFPHARGTMSAHFAILRDADLIADARQGKSVIYRLRLSVLEDALLGIADSFGIGFPRAEPANKPTEEGA